VDAGSLQTSSNGASVRVAHTASLDTDDQYVEITYAGYEGTGTINVTIAINFQPDESRYEVVYSRSNERLVLCKVSGDNTNLGPNFDLPRPLAAGDRIRIERNESNLIALWDNGTGFVPVIAGTDSALTGGKISLACYFNNSNRALKITNFAGGDLI
jgi:hypothetical protein